MAPWIDPCELVSRVNEIGQLSVLSENLHGRADRAVPHRHVAEAESIRSSTSDPLRERAFGGAQAWPQRSDSNTEVMRPRCCGAAMATCSLGRRVLADSPVASQSHSPVRRAHRGLVLGATANTLNALGLEGRPSFV
jgi:hypothetical protein